jgi:hypothetical protein
MKFTLPAPASVEWYRSGVPGGGQRDHIFNRLKAKLIGGKDDSGTGYFPMHDRKISSSDADKIIANMKQDEDGYPSFSTGSTSGEAEREYQEWIIDRYLVDTPKTTQEPENIPVEIEVVEVEQKTVDEPIVVKIEAPFEPEPKKKLEAPKRIRLPRRSGVMKARPIGPPKKSVATRMAEAFDRRLDDVVDSIQNPPAPAPPKQRKQKEALVKIKKKVKPAKFKSNYKEKGNVKPFENLGKYGFTKIKSALGRAADARRMAQEQGLPEQEKGFYATRALGFEFGGDRIARVRGTFAKSPDATLDPALSKQQRYTAGLFGTRTIRPAGKGGNFQGLTKEFEKLDERLKNIISIKKESPDSSETTKEFDKTVEEIREALKKGNKLQKDINSSKKEQAKIARDAANDAEMAAEEAAIEGTEDTASVREIEKEEEGKKEDDGGGGGGFRLGSWLKNLKRTAGKWLRRIRNPRKTFQAIRRLAAQKLKKIPGVKGIDNWMKKNKPFQGAKQWTDDAIKGATQWGDNAVKGARQWGDNAWKGITQWGDNLAKNTRQAGSNALKSSRQWADDVIDGVSRFGRTFGDDAIRYGSRGLAFVKNSPVAKRIAIASGKYGGRMVPVAGSAVSAADAADRASRGDAVGAWLAGIGGTAGLVTVATSPAAVSGVGAAAPAIAEAVSIAADTGLFVYDIFNAITGREFTAADKEAMDKQKASDDAEIQKRREAASKGYMPSPDAPWSRRNMSEGGTVKLADGGVNAMVGEAGPELVTNGPGGMNPLQSLAPMIVSMRELTKRAGTWADPVENMVRQITDPIAKQLKLPVLPASLEIGGGGTIEEPSDDIMGAIGGGIGGFGQNVLDTFSKLFSGKGGLSPGAAGGFQGATLSGSAAQLIGNDTEFLAEVTRVCRKFGIKEGDLLGLMASESGFNPASDNGTHVGLIQFSRDSARAVGTTQAALKGMTRAQQMKYVEKYFDHWKSAGYFPDNPTAGQLYSVVFAPAYANKQDHEALYSAGSAAYNSNRPLDTNNDGQITMAEMGQRIQRKKQEFGITDSGVSTPTATPPGAPPAAPSLPTTPPITPQAQQPNTGSTGVSLLPLLSPPPAAPQPPPVPFTMGSPFMTLPGTSLTQLQLLRLAQ